MSKSVVLSLCINHRCGMSGETFLANVTDDGMAGL